MSSAPNVVVVGSINVDQVVRAERHPAPGESVLGHSPETLSGGKGANQALASAAAGASTALVGAVGTDAAGRRMRDGLAHGGVDVSSVHPTDGAATGHAFVIVADTGENTIVIVPGANAEVSVDAVARAIEPGTRVVLTQLELPLAVARAALLRAREVGAISVLNASPIVDGAEELAGLADVLVVNEHEHALLGRPDACVTIGARGAVWGTITATPAPVEVVDTTGAGDAFAGTLAASLAQGMSRELALQAAVDAGTRATTHRGAQG